MKPTIGFIGLGIMGRHMATHLIEAGYSLSLYDINPSALEAVVTKGGVAMKSCQEVSAASEIVISMVPDSPEVEEVVFGEYGLLKGIHPGMIYIDMSTILPATAIKIASVLEEKGVCFLDAPVSGGEIGAKNATLSIMVGGSRETLDQVMPIFQVLGKTITLCGGHGAGQVVKACNQIQVALNIVGMSEAFTLGAKAGVDPAIILKVLSTGYAQTRVMDVRGPKVIHGDFDPGFKSKFHLKDLKIIAETAKNLNVPLPATSTVYQLFIALINSGRGDLDHTAVINILEELAGAVARTKSEDA
jgi:2-hydroxy-3-oxopropionate reductase